MTSTILSSLFTVMVAVFPIAKDTNYQTEPSLLPAVSDLHSTSVIAKAEGTKGGSNSDDDPIVPPN